MYALFVLKYVTQLILRSIMEKNILAKRLELRMCTLMLNLLKSVSHFHTKICYLIRNYVCHGFLHILDIMYMSFNV